jgi:S-adenosylmethionine:tRNA ribosyltransferase-isomerase
VSWSLTAGHRLIAPPSGIVMIMTEVRTQDFDYDLPGDLIAYTPAENREDARLMVLERPTGSIRHSRFRHLADFLHAGDLVVVNDTRVIRARLKGRKQPTGGAVELLVLREIDPLRWEVLVSPSRRLHVATEIDLGAGYSCRITERLEGAKRVAQFSHPVDDVLGAVGLVPLPPYIKREPEALDLERYQTVYASRAGSVAAPTAGLHFSQDLLDGLRTKRIEIAALTLHVGMGTFVPVRDEDPRRHVLEPEYFEIDEACCRSIVKACSGGGRVIAVGTTTVRALETAADRSDGEGLAPQSGWTHKFILPPYRFRVVDALITNFHLPRSTLLMLVSAFAGTGYVIEAYREAVHLKYRFFSYGDAMLIL